MMLAHGNNLAACYLIDIGVGLILIGLGIIIISVGIAMAIDFFFGLSDGKFSDGKNRASNDQPNEKELP